LQHGGGTNQGTNNPSNPPTLPGDPASSNLPYITFSVTGTNLSRIIIEATTNLADKSSWYDIATNSVPVNGTNIIQVNVPDTERMFFKTRGEK